MSTESTFKTALPYGIVSLSAGVIGTIIAVGATSTAIKIAAIAIALFGAWSLLATIFCGLINSGNPEGFREELPKFAVTFIASGIADIITAVAKALIFSWIHRRESRA
ncbi:MAG: hypothetical protein A3F40_00495 [Chlamydiae bacterium RIFCSPHIGHO2_12_FULL_27_8]|nr:MAG: hypothetical protein A3F40_00495 [Chlamydiae bacterium RIFCSPHIGHO2_12_FULL_27_8]